MVILLQLPASYPLRCNTLYEPKIFSKGSVETKKTVFHNQKPVVKDGVLIFNSYHALKGIPDNVVVTPWTKSSVFLGATSTSSSSRHVFKLGEIE